jgi:hypothetical protein
MQWSEYTEKVSRRSERWASSDRGWLFIGELSYGNYLDYGADHFRSSHDYCPPGECRCRLSQPGNIHAVRFGRNADGQAVPGESRYFETVADAKAWIEEPHTGPGLFAGQ